MRKSLLYPSDIDDLNETTAEDINNRLDISDLDHEQVLYLTGHGVYKDYKILFVDDLAETRKYFKKSHDKKFDIVTADSVLDGWSYVKKNHTQIGVVISDIKMPKESGINLLWKCRTHFPGIVRVVYTAYSDPKTSVAAINLAQVYRYLLKPLTRETVHNELVRCFLHYKSDAVYRDCARTEFARRREETKEGGELLDQIQKKTGKDTDI